MAPLIRFNNDYSRGAHSAILDALSRTNREAYPGYGTDEWCEEASRLIRAACAAPDATVHFATGGTPANVVAISHILRPWESVLAPETAHIHVHETGAAEHAGHKIEALAAPDGKIRSSQVREAARAWETSPVPEHVTRPRMVSVSFPTENGMLYSRTELAELREACDAHGLYLHIDGARMAYGLGAPQADATLADIAAAADTFTIGGTKCGALFGEAVVVTNPHLAAHYRSSLKQNNAMLAKGWLLGLQFATLFEPRPGSGNGCLYFEIGREAVAQALRIRRGLADAGIEAWSESPTNQQFALFTASQLAALGARYAYQEWGPGEPGPDGEPRTVARLCTSWATTQAEVDALLADLPEIAKA